MKRNKLHILCIIGIIFTSCLNNNDTTVTTSSETEVTSFYFAKNDSFPSIGNTTFTISLYAAQDTGLITNADSMTYLTPVNKLVPHLLFKATPASATIFTTDTAFALTGKDTIDFTHPVLLRIISSDQTNTKYYRVVVNVHQVDPDLFYWNKLTDAVLPQGTASTKGVVLNGRFYLFANDGFATTVYQSADGKSWDAGTTPVGLPANCHVRDILAANDTHSGAENTKLYYCQDSKVYTSTDAASWQEQDMSAETYLPRVMLMHFNDSVWLVSEHASAHTFHLSVEDGGSWRTDTKALPANWPLTEFTAVEFTSSSERPRVMIVGGYDTQGNGLNSRWNIEYSQAAGYRYANFAIERPLCSAILGASAICYGKRFYLFGGVDADAKYVSETALYSDDEGLNWFPIDTAHNHLMDVYSERTQTSAFVHDSNVYLFGGQTRTQTFSDVLRGRLTSIDW
ncbi:MAG: hypothetical protein IJT12_03540 [Paludibacteraceae bacterium]|nr:hypothetical protein [Paludibacteraceae bacterium]